MGQLEIKGLGGEGVDQPVASLCDLRGHGGNFFAGEGAQNQAAQPAVARRLKLKHRVALIGLPVGEVGGTLGRGQGLSAKFAVCQQPAHRPVADGSWHLIVIPPHQITHRAGAVIGGIGILHKTGICGRLFEYFHVAMTAETVHCDKMC